KDDKIRTFISPDSVAIENVISMAKERSGNIWVLSRPGLFRIDTAGKIIKTGLMEQEFRKNNEMPTDIKIDNRGHVWLITTASRLYDFNPATGTYTTWASKLSTAAENRFMRNVMAADSSGNIWMATNAGLQYFDRRT